MVECQYMTTYLQAIRQDYYVFYRRLKSLISKK